MDRVDRDFDWAILRLTVPIDYTYRVAKRKRREAARGGARRPVGRSRRLLNGCVMRLPLCVIFVCVCSHPSCRPPRQTAAPHGTICATR